MNIVLVETSYGLFVGEEVGMFRTVLSNPYKIYFEENDLRFESLGVGIAEVSEITIPRNNIIYKEEVTPEFKESYSQALEKDSKL